MRAAQTHNVRPLSGGRRWGFRCAAVLLGLSVFPLAELVCACCGWGVHHEVDDPFVGFSDVYPLFVRNSETAHWEIPKSRRKFFKPESFPVDKGGRRRVFCFGGSTVQGRPFATETSFTSWLEIALNCATPKQSWRVINCGGVSYASYRLVPIVEECLQYDPDLFVICTGHNEFLEERTYAHVKYASGWLNAAQRALAQSRCVTVMRGAIRPESAEDTQLDRDVLRAEVDALLDYRGGIRAYQRDLKWRRGVVQHYEYNLRRMIAIAQHHGIPVLLVQPPSNLGDCPPFKSLSGSACSAADRARRDAWLNRARNAQRSDVAQAVSCFEQALAIDDQLAIVWYELGKCYETMHNRDRARQAFLQAREQDICPLRMIAPLEQALQRVARETRTPLVDAHALLEQQVPGGILGDYLLVDHIHPSIRGHQLIAERLTNQVLERMGLEAATAWRERAHAQWQLRFDTLDAMYFLHGKRTLEALREWTKGRADGPPIESRLDQPTRAGTTQP
ncbi:MAG: SGNH/GDSL hydrolase family protein [Planctomycetaceae bacterium]